MWIWTHNAPSFASQAPYRAKLQTQLRAEKVIFSTVCPPLPNTQQWVHIHQWLVVSSGLGGRTDHGALCVHSGLQRLLTGLIIPKIISAGLRGSSVWPLGSHPSWLGRRRSTATGAGLAISMILFLSTAWPCKHAAKQEGRQKRWKKGPNLSEMKHWHTDVHHKYNRP